MGGERQRMARGEGGTGTARQDGGGRECCQWESVASWQFQFPMGGRRGREGKREKKAGEVKEILKSHNRGEGELRA